MKNQLIAMFLVLILVFTLTACSAKPESATASQPDSVPEIVSENEPATEPGSEVEPKQEVEPESALDSFPDPNIGVYTASLVEMYGLEMDPGEIYSEGFIIELKEGGKCTIITDGKNADGTWSLENGVLTVDDGSSTATGTLANGVMKLINMLEQGLSITLEKQKSRSFAYTDESLSEKYNTEIVATVGDHQLTNAVLQIFYWATVYDDLNENIDDLSFRGPDVAVPFAEQYFDETVTWEQHYLQDALENYHHNAALAEEAVRNDFTVSDATQKRIDDIPENLEAQVSENGFTEVEDYLAQSFGPCVDVDDYLEYFSITSLASDYAGTLEDESNIDSLFSKYELNVDYENLHLYDIVSRSAAQDAAEGP